MVRLAEEKDIPRILDLLKQVCKVHHDIRPDLFLLSTKYNADALKEILSDKSRPIFVCVNDEDDVMGYGFCILVDYTDVDVRTNIRSIYIDDICVDEKYRRMHVATKVYNKIYEFAKENGYYNISLNVWEGNDSARKFYEGLGMTIQKTTLETIIK